MNVIRTYLFILFSLSLLSKKRRCFIINKDIRKEVKLKIIISPDMVYSDSLNKLPNLQKVHTQKMIGWHCTSGTGTILRHFEP